MRRESPQHPQRPHDRQNLHARNLPDHDRDGRLPRYPYPSAIDDPSHSHRAKPLQESHELPRSLQSLIEVPQRSIQRAASLNN